MRVRLRSIATLLEVFQDTHCKTGAQVRRESATDTSWHLRGCNGSFPERDVHIQGPVGLMCEQESVHGRSLAEGHEVPPTSLTLTRVV